MNLYVVISIFITYVQIAAANAATREWPLMIGSSAESVANEFVFIFPWNNGGAQQPPTITLDLINQNDLEANVTLSYSTINGEQRVDTIEVGPFQMASHTFESDVANYCDGALLVACPDTRVVIQSNVPISATANDFFEFTPSAGDSFTVVPTSMAGNNYSFALPAPADGYSTIYFIPISNSVNIQCSIWTTDGNRTINFTSSVSDKKLFAYRSNSELTIYATGDALFVIIAAVCNLVEMDFGVIMPTPIQRHKNCSGDKFEDYHPLALLSANYYYPVAAQPSCSSTATIYTSNGTDSETMEIEARSLLQFLDPSKIGRNAVIYSKDGVIQIGAYGGYKLSPDNLFSGYGYLDMVFSSSKFVTGPTLFSVPTINNYVMVIGDEETARTAQFDGDKEILKWQSCCASAGTTFYFSVVVNLDDGLHIIYSSGHYIVSVAGVSPQLQFAYSFTPAFNAGSL